MNNTKYLFCILLNLAFVIIEAGAGYYSNSVGLFSDAGHNLSDVFTLILALIAALLSKSQRHQGYTYGYRKASVLISLLNAVILLFAVGLIFVESIEKFRNPEEVNGATIAWVAGVGILVNGLTTWLLMKDQKHDINARGAFLHMAADTLVSIGVVITGLIIKYTGFVIIDPIISIVIAIVILISTWDLLKESVRMCIDAVPENIDINKINETILSHDGVKSVHHIHIWPISTRETALTAHLVIENYLDGKKIVPEVKAALKDAGIEHATLEIETPDSNCQDL